MTLLKDMTGERFKNLIVLYLILTLSLWAVSVMTVMGSSFAFRVFLVLTLPGSVFAILLGKLVGDVAFLVASFATPFINVLLAVFLWRRS